MQERKLQERILRHAQKREAKKQALLEEERNKVKILVESQKEILERDFLLSYSELGFQSNRKQVSLLNGFKGVLALSKALFPH